MQKIKTAPPREFFIPDLCTVQAVLFLVVVAELLALVLELASTGLQGLNWQSFAITSLFVLWNFLLSAGLLCQLRPHLSHHSLAMAAAVSYLVILAVVALTSVAGQWVLKHYLGSGRAWFDPWLLGTHVLICAVLAGITLRYFYLAQQLRLRQKAELQARIQALQSRIRPHFLFNSMNIIASLIAVDQQAAEMAVEDLAALFRASLAEAEAEVPWEEELALCRRYVRIEQLRLGDRLKMEWQVETVPASTRIPGLALQPLLENAIYHGIQRLSEGGTVAVSAAVEEGELRIEVTNPIPTGQYAEETRTEGNRLAQENIHQRLQALYGPRAGLATEKSGGYHRAIIYYPVSETATGESA